MANANGNVKAALRYLDAHRAEFLEQLVDLSRIPGVSADGYPPRELQQISGGRWRRHARRWRRER